MLHGRETWGPNNPELQRLCCNDHAMILWICGIKDRDKMPSFTATETWHWGYILWSFAVGNSDSMAMYSRPHPVSILSQTFQFPALESKEGLGHDLIVWSLMSMTVAWLALTHKTEMHGEPVFDIAWRCQPHRMGHGQGRNLKMDMDGWMDREIYKKNLKKKDHPNWFAIALL